VNRHFMDRVTRIKDGHHVILTKRELLGILGVRSGSLARLEELAGIPFVPRRAGYTAPDARKILAAMSLLLTSPRKGRGGKKKP